MSPLLTREYLAHVPTLLLICGATLFGIGCASEGMMRSDGAGAYDESYAGDDDDAPDEWGDDDDDMDGNDGAESPPPESERDFMPRPQVTDIWVFVPNPERDTVSKINAQTRDIYTLEVGRRPTEVVITPDYSLAAAFNADSDSVSIIDVATDTVEELSVREDFNDILISPDGQWVVAFFNTEMVDADFTVEGVRSYTEVSFVNTVSRTVQSASVGFNPKDVQFTADGTRAVIITDAYFTVVDLTVDPIEFELLDLDADPASPPSTAEVLLGPTGEYALVRNHEWDDLQLVDLETGSLDYLPVGEDPSDMDLSPDASSIIVVARGSKELHILPASDPSAGETVLELPETETLGSLVIDPTGETGILYTTAVAQDRVTFWNIETNELSVRRVEKPVDAVSLSPDGRSALLLHSLADVEGENDLYTSNYALSVVDLDTRLINAVLLEAEPTSWTTSTDGRYSMFMMENNRNVGVIDYRTRLVDDIYVPSVPAFVGFMPTVEDTPPIGWISQEHELGRISFLAPDALEVQTITGFELNSVID